MEAIVVRREQPRGVGQRPTSCGGGAPGDADASIRVPTLAQVLDPDHVPASEGVNVLE